MNKEVIQFDLGRVREMALDMIAGIHRDELPLSDIMSAMSYIIYIYSKEVGVDSIELIQGIEEMTNAIEAAVVNIK